MEAILVASLLCSVCRSFFSPAKDASLPAIAPENRLFEANSFNAVTFNFVTMGGLAFSAGILAIVYGLNASRAFSYTLIINALTFVVSAAFILRLPNLVPAREGPISRPFEDAREGLAYVASRKDLSLLMLVLLLSNLAFAPFFPIYVKGNEVWFGGLPQTITWFECSFFVGVVCGSWLVGKAKYRKLGQGTVLSHALLSVLIAGMGALRTVPIWIGLNFLCGIFLPMFWLLRENYLQMCVPDAIRGRVQGIKGIAVSGIQPFGLVLGGVVIDIWGLESCFYLIAGLGVSVSLAALFSRSFRNLEVPREANPTEPNSRPEGIL